jgi:hypothetical protein
VELLVVKLPAVGAGLKRLVLLEKEVGVGEIVSVAGERMKLQGCWEAVGHGVEAEAAGIHDGGDCFCCRRLFLLQGVQLLRRFLSEEHNKEYDY